MYAAPSDTETAGCLIIMVIGAVLAVIGLCVVVYWLVQHVRIQVI